MNDVRTAAGSPPRTAGDDYSFTGEVRAFWERLPNKGLFGILALGWLALFHFLGNSTFGYVETGSLFQWMFNAYTRETEVADDGHGVIMPFVVLGLLWWKRDKLVAGELRAWWPALVLVFLAMLLHVLGYLLQQTRLSIVAFFLGFYGLMGLAWGWHFLRASFFPYVLFVFMVPLGSLTEKVTFPLRLLVTELVVMIGKYGLGADVAAVGTQLVNPSMQYQYEIAVPCSGMRSLIAISLIAVVYAYVALRGWWPRTALVAAAIPLAVIGNTFRMLLIILASQIGGQSWGNFVHDNSAFSLTPYIPAIFGLIWLGGKLEKRQAEAATRPAFQP
jgi:exosortase